MQEFTPEPGSLKDHIARLAIGLRKQAHSGMPVESMNLLALFFPDRVAVTPFPFDKSSAEYALIGRSAGPIVGAAVVFDSYFQPTNDPGIREVADMSQFEDRPQEALIFFGIGDTGDVASAAFAYARDEHGNPVFDGLAFNESKDALTGGHIDALREIIAAAKREIIWKARGEENARFN